MATLPEVAVDATTQILQDAAARAVTPRFRSLAQSDICAKGADDMVTVADLGQTALIDHAGICGRLLAKGQARTSGAAMIAVYVRSTGKLDRPLRRFALAYAGQTERNHQALVDAVARGLLPAEHGVST